MQSNLSKSLVADLLLAVMAVIWGMGFPVTQMAIDANLGPGMIVAVRFWIATVVMGAVFWRELRTLTGREIRYGMIGGALLVSSFILQTVGLQYTTPSNNAFLTSTNVVIVPFLSWFLFKNRPTKKMLLVAAGCFVGAAVLTVSPDKGLQLGFGDTLTLLCALIFSFHICYLGSLAGKITASKLSFLQMLVSAVIGTAYLFIFESQTIPQADFSAGVWPMLYLGLLSTAFCFFAQTYAQAHTSPARAAVILGTEGLLGSIFSVMLGYEALTTNLILGGTIIFVCLLAMEVDIPKLLGRKKEALPQETA